MLNRSGGRTPLKIQTDQGKEFFNHKFEALWKDSGIVDHYYSRDPEIKCSYVERFNRTLKDQLSTYFMWTNRLRWVDILPQFVRRYNMSHHTSIGTSPTRVLHMSDSELEDLWHKQYRPMNAKEKKLMSRDLTQIKRGQLVRVATTRRMFEKGYNPRWQREIFKVAKVTYSKHRVGYKLVDLKSEPIDGIFYWEQLRKHTGDVNTGRVIEKVISRTPKTVTVKYLGYPAKFNQTLPISKYNKMIKANYQHHGSN